MTSVDLNAVSTAPTMAQRAGVPTTAFASTLFLPAFLLFAKMVLPRLGGSPGVWSVAMVVFQTLLLAGYAYAHALNRWLPGMPGIALHLVVTLAAAATLPFSLGSASAPPADGEMLYVIGVFVTAIGPSFFALSANGPLLQAWFVHSGHKSAHDPYFLYAASNVGSFLALFAYPFVLEPMLTLGQQRQYWTIGYYVLLALLAVCGFLIARRWKHADAMPKATAGEGGPISLRTALGWIALAAVPSGLLVAVSQQIATEVASAPLLWVVPLALYLVTFVIVFQKRPIIPHVAMVWLQPLAVAAVIVTTALDIVDNIAILLVVHLVAFFIATMMCHGELVKRRPPAHQLTAFYLAMSFGGMLGGMFCGLIAPNIFNWVAEYPLLIVLSLLCRPGIPFREAVKQPLFAFAAVAAVGAIVACTFLFGRGSLNSWYSVQLWIIGFLIVAALVLCFERTRIAVLVAACFLVLQYFPSDGPGRETVRSCFGVHKISDSPDGRFRILSHGTTIHGVQAIKDKQGNPITTRPVPISYYFEGGPIAQSVRAARENAGGPITLGVVGLGTGAMMCHSKEGDDFRFFEIDADVVRIARNPRWFTYLSECGPKQPINMGDARLTLEKEPDGTFDALLVDAFSSDAIPVHLITLEALRIFVSKLKDKGIVAFHVSNRYLDLVPVLANLAEKEDLRILFNSDSSENWPGKTASTWVVLSKSKESLDPLLSSRMGPGQVLEMYQGLLALPTFASTTPGTGRGLAYAMDKLSLDMNISEANIRKMVDNPNQESDEANLLRRIRNLYMEPADSMASPAGGVGAAGLMLRSVIPLCRGASAWRMPEPDPKVGLWTDDYSNLIAVWNRRHGEGKALPPTD